MEPAPALLSAAALPVAGFRPSPIGPRWPRVVSMVWSRPSVRVDETAWLDITTADLCDGAVLVVRLLRRARPPAADVVLATATAHVMADRASLAFSPRTVRRHLGPGARVVARAAHPDIVEAQSGPLAVRVYTNDPSSDPRPGN